MKMDIKKSAFTLSEVLLTIALIGFLATMTLATIGSSVQQRARLAEFRTAYSRMDIALRSILDDYGYIPACHQCLGFDDPRVDEFGLGTKINRNNCPNSAHGATACGPMLDKFAKAMGAIRTCNVNPIDEGCLPPIYPTKTGFTNYNTMVAYVLENGMILFAPKSGAMFGMDINGRKGPNKWGLDIFPFAFTVTEQSKVLKNIQGSYMVTDIGILPPASSVNDVTSSASVKSTSDMMKESAVFK